MANDHPPTTSHAADAGHGDAHGETHAHPDWGTYKWVALILTAITVAEVWIYYTSLRHHPLFVPILLVLSAAKFAIVVMFYMHLKYDAVLFRALFTGPLTIACITLISLLFLFGHLAIRFGR